MIVVKQKRIKSKSWEELDTITLATRNLNPTSMHYRLVVGNSLLYEQVKVFSQLLFV